MGSLWLGCAAGPPGRHRALLKALVRHCSSCSCFLQSTLCLKQFITQSIWATGLTVNEKTKAMAGKGDRPFSGLSTYLSTLLDRWRPPQELVLLATALLVGLATGLAAILFRYLIIAISWVGYVWVPEVTPGTGRAYVIFVPALGGLVVGLLVYYLAREAKGHGVPEVMEAVALRGGRIRPRVAVVKSLASSVTIGSGGSAGREGPIVQIGSAIGSTVGQVLNLSDDRISNLVACGAAAGIAATFNAPIAGVFFALEVILGRFTVRHFSLVVVAAVAASVVGRAAFGDVPAFAIPFEYGITSVWEFLLYPVLGVLAGLVGVVFTKSLYASEDLFAHMRHLPEWFKPAVGGALLGVLALAYPLIRLTQPVTWTRIPQVFNVGYDIIESALANEMLLGVALVLLIAKIVATNLTLGSGGSGGVFAPSLFMGAMLGAAFELIAGEFLPGIVGPPGAYALVGMAAVFAATGHAPITAVLILFELTGDYRIILPLMLTVVIATVISQRLMRGESIYTLKLTRRNVRLSRGRDVDILSGVQVREVMTREFMSVLESATIGEAARAFASSRSRSQLVLDEAGNLVGIVTLSDIERATELGASQDQNIRMIASVRPKLLVTYPGESVGEALAKMGTRGIGQLPVVSRKDGRRVRGLISRIGITKAYALALSRKAEIAQETRQLQQEYKEKAEFATVTLSPTDPIVGSKVASLADSLPRDCILVSIDRNGRMIIPRGDTVLEPGDKLTAFLRSDLLDSLYDIISEGSRAVPSDGENVHSN